MDYTIFTIVIITCYSAFYIWLKRTGRSESFPWGLWLILLGLLGFGWIYTESAGKAASHEVQEMVEGFPPTYAQEVQRMGHAKLPNNANPQDPIYLAIIEAQIRWEQVNPSVADIYTMRKTPEGKNILIVDSETDYNRDGKFEGEREQRTPIGEVYDKEIPALEKAFNGVAAFMDEPYSDKWGHWVSAFTPLYNAKGEIEGVLGVDYPAENWIDAIRTARNHSMIVLGLLALMLGASSAVVLVLQNQITVRARLEQEVLEIREREQSRLGQDLHDDLGQQLTGLGMLSQRIAGKLATENHFLSESAAELTTYIKEAIVTARNMARSFYPVELEGGGIKRALEDFAQRTRKLTSIDCTSQFDPEFSVTKDASIHVYRLVQEAVSNTIKHAKATKISIVGTVRNGVQKLSITDNGIGLNEANKGKQGIGLHLFQYRARLIKAEVTVANVVSGTGCEVTCVFHK
ncbi:MAG: histidine kinase [Verrucomicrobiota bacterium]